MPYPVRLIGGTDRVQTRPPNGRWYAIGDRIDDLDDDTRGHLQANGVRFEAIHDDTPPLPADVPAALNDQIAAEKPKTAPKRGDD